MHQRQLTSGGADAGASAAQHRSSDTAARGSTGTGGTEMIGDALTRKASRREALRLGVAGTALGVAGLLAAPAGPAAAQVRGPESVQVAEIYELQAAFHRAKTAQDIALMMSLWDPAATLAYRGDPNSPYIGFARLRAFWLSSGSFTHRRFSLVPSFKTEIRVHGEEAYLYFECHDIGDYDQPSRYIAHDSFLAGTLRKRGGAWVFWNMTAGIAAPLSADHYYFP